MAGQTTTQQVVGLIGFGIMAAILGPGPYGLVAMELVIVNLFAIMLNQGLLEGLIQQSDVTPSQINSMFWFVQGTSILFAAGMVATATIVADLYGQPQLFHIQLAMSPVPVLIAAAAIPTVLARRKLQFRTLAIRTMIAVLLGAAVGVGLAIGGFGIWAIVGMQLTQYSATAVVLWTLTCWRPGLQVSWRALRGLVIYGLQIVLLRGLTFLEGQGPRFIIGLGMGPVPLGYLHFAATVVRFVAQLFISPFSGIGISATARLQHDPTKVDQLLSTATRFGSLLVYPAFVGIAAIAPVLVPWMFGAKWLPAVPVLQILTVSGITRLYIEMSDVTVRGLGKPKWLLITRTAQALFSVVLVIAAAPYGIVAVATVLAAKGLVLLPLNVWILHRAGGPRLGPIIIGNLPIITAAALMGACVLGWLHFMRAELSDPALLASAILIGVGAYVVFACLLVRPLLREVILLLRSALLDRAQVPRSKFAAESPHGFSDG